jgi:hypothetical protein
MVRGLGIAFTDRAGIPIKDSASRTGDRSVCRPLEMQVRLAGSPDLISLPPIAGETAGQPITVMVDLYERSTAAVASTGHSFEV